MQAICTPDLRQNSGAGLMTILLRGIETGALQAGTRLEHINME